LESPQHIRQVFDEELNALEHDVLEMGSIADVMVQNAVESLVDLDVEKAMGVVQKDDEVDRHDLQIESRCLKLLALHHPAAGDFRTVGTTLKIITDIERVGDLAVDIAKAGMKIEKVFGDSRVVDIPRMAGAARSQFRKALQSYAQRDLALVDEVTKMDDEVDDLFRQLRAQIHKDMVAAPEHVVADSWLLLAIHHIERIADHAVNVAERVSYMVTGDFKQFPRGDIPVKS
jgi:phosphate transport system protein